MKRLALLLLLAACPGDDDEPCGLAAPGPAEAALLEVGDQAFTYGGFVASLGGDCPTGDNPRGSVTIIGQQIGSGFPLTFCLRDERDVPSPATYDLADGEALLVVDVSARDAAGCTYGKDTGAPDLEGTLSFDGFCTRDGAVYELGLAGSLAGVKNCPVQGGPPVSESVRLELAGRASVTMQDAPAARR